MGESFLELITNNAMNERFDRIIMDDVKYQELQKQVDALYGEFDALGLSDEQRHVIDRLMSGRTEADAYYSFMAYRQGFIDCAKLSKEVCTERSQVL